jgi:hypothetical protein
MDYFQGVVTEYLRAKRSVFVNTECLLQLDEGSKQVKDRHWYCDVVAVDFKERAVSLCEITYSATQQSLLARLQAWKRHWPALVHAVHRDSGAPEEWAVRPWLFLPKRFEPEFKRKYAALPALETSGQVMPEPRITHLEAVVPWEYVVTWDRKHDALAGDA